MNCSACYNILPTTLHAWDCSHALGSLLPKPGCNDQRCKSPAVCDRQSLSRPAEALHRILFVTCTWCQPAVAWYPTVFLALIGIAGITTALVSVLYGGHSRPYATFLVVSHSGTLPSCTLSSHTGNQLITVFPSHLWCRLEIGAV